MTRTISTAVLVLLVLLNGAAGIMEASGVNDALNMSVDPGGDDTIQERENVTREDRDVGGGFGSTLFGVFAKVAGVFGTLLDIVFLAPTMFNNLGVPSYFTAAIFGPMYFISLLDIFFALSGRKL